MDFERIYHTHADSVYSFLMFKLHDEHLAEELMQETFLAVYEQKEGVVQIESLKAWILTIARNKLVDHLRKDREQVRLVQEMMPEEAEKASDGVFVEELLGQLPEPERTIVYGLYVEGLTCNELGQMLAIPEGTVKSKAYYARQNLARWLKGGDLDGADTGTP